MRMFAAITPPPAVLDHLDNALTMLGDLPAAPARTDRRQRPQTRRAALRSPWTPRDSWHITLAFFGDVPRGTVPDLEAAIAAATREIPPFTILLAGAGSFRRTTMWIGVGGESAPLAGLMRALVGVCDAHTLVRDNRERNRAHLTVSRAGATVDAALVAHALAIYRGPEWSVGGVDLVESELGTGAEGRAVHRTWAHFPLQDGRDSLTT